ncbi:MAG: hypothetical protein KF861_11980, partial [Planctomycetaceae bacterium]|nr:hypothetical protein [Planctomycetaceae bacterium]
VGGVAVVGTSLWMLVLAFQESLGWGLAYIFIPFAALVFLIQHWDKAKQPFLLSLLAVVVFMAGGMMAGTGLGGAGAGAGF